MYVSYCGNNHEFNFAAYKEKIPFTKPAPVDQEETAKQKKQKAGHQPKKQGG